MTEETKALAKWEESGVAIETVGMARAMVQSGYFKSVTSVAQAIVKIEMGKSLGVSPVEAIQYLHIFSTGGGARTNVQLGYPLVGALIQRSGKYHFDVRRRDDEVCEIDFYLILPTGDMKRLGTSRFTFEKATKAGLVTKDIWKAYPDVMLFARALTHGAKTFCPEILGGADVGADQAYIEGHARTPGEDAEEAVSPVIEEPPGGFPRPWARFWAFATGPQPEGLGMTEEEVHQFFGVSSLKESATRIMENTGKTEAEVVAEFELTLREGHQPGDADEPAPPDDGQQADEEEAHRQEAEAGIAQGSEPADAGLE